MTRRLLLALVASLLLAGPAAAASRSSEVAALQIALRSKGLYAGTIDGVAGRGTKRALVRLQRRAGLSPDGIAGPATRAALGRRGRHELGSRQLRAGAVGWDVARLQFLLAWHGFPSGSLDGEFGDHTESALLRFQRWAGLAADGRVGPATVRALRGQPARSPIRLAWPIRTLVGDLFGPRGDRFHAGVDLLASSGTPVAAAGAGHVVWSGYLSGGWGLLVTIVHRRGLRSMYAHLSRVDVRVGEPVRTGEVVGLVGATGDATGPHLHFELRLRGAAVDPLTALE